MARRRKKARWQVIPVWTGALVLVGWGVWQAREFHRSVLTEVEQKEALGLRDAPAENQDEPTVTTRPELAVAGASVSKRPITPASGGHNPIVSISATIDAVDPLRNDTMMDVGDGSYAVVAMPVFDAALSAEELAARGYGLLDEGKIVEGRSALNAALVRAHDESLAERLRETLTELNVPVFLGTGTVLDDPMARTIEIQSGDNFLRLGRSFGLTGAFVEFLNPGLNPRNLKPLTGVKIVQGPFRLRLSKGARRIDVYAQDMYVHSLYAEEPEGNYLPVGEYQIATGTKLQLGGTGGVRTWIGFEGIEAATEGVASGWIFGAAGPRGKTAQDRAAGIRLAEPDLRELYNVLVEARSHLRVEP